MAKEFVKGVTVGEATAEENTQPAVSTVETNEEETKQVIRANEEDFIAGLIAAADFASDEEETQRIEIVRNGKLAFAFSIRPLGSEEYDKCRKKFTKYVRNKQLGIKMPEDTDRIKYQSAIIHKATIAEDREKLWDNKKVWQALESNAQKEDIEAAEKKMEGLSVLHKLLCMVSAMVADADLVEWNYTYNTVRGKRVKAFYGILEQYGFQFPNDEEKSVVEGTSDLYVKKEC